MGRALVARRPLTVMYRLFAQQFLAWYARLGPGAGDRVAACLFLSVIQFVDVFALTLVLTAPSPMNETRALSACFVVTGALFGANWIIFRRLPVPGRRVRWGDAVPGVREFPAVYAFLVASVAFFVAVLWVARQ